MKSEIAANGAGAAPGWQNARAAPLVCVLGACYAGTSTATVVPASTTCRMQRHRWASQKQKDNPLFGFSSTILLTRNKKPFIKRELGL